MLICLDSSHAYKLGKISNFLRFGGKLENFALLSNLAFKCHSENNRNRVDHMVLCGISTQVFIENGGLWHTYSLDSAACIDI